MDELTECLRVRVAPQFKRRLEQTAEEMQIHLSALIRQSLAQALGTPGEQGLPAEDLDTGMKGNGGTPS